MQDQDQNPDPTLTATTTALPPQPKDSLRLEYRLVVTGAGQTPVNIEGRTDLPMALSEHSLSDADETYGKAFQILLEQPARAAVRTMVNQLCLASIKRQQPGSSWLDKSASASETSHPAGTVAHRVEGADGEPPTRSPSMARQAV